MQILASDALQNVEKIPLEFWWKSAIFIAVFVGVIIALRKIAHMNKVVLAVICFVVLTVIGFNWIYQRNEPAFLTPVVDKIAPFLPTRGKHPGY